MNSRHVRSTGGTVNTYVENLLNKKRGKKSSKELAEMLIQAQELERARIARELHDNVCQQIAALGITLSRMKNKLRETNTVEIKELSALQERVSDLANEIRAVTHDLHPGILRYAGLETAVRSGCAEFSARSGMEVEVVTTGDFSNVSTDVSLCVYRIFQESLHNIQNHANARSVKISLKRSTKFLELIVEDDGRGFDQNEAMIRGGLGLVSMDERVRLVRGQIRIQTQPFIGTNVQLQIPI